jgi:hypothetical protein
MSPRDFTAAIAGVVLLAGLWGLFWMVQVPSPAGMDERLICGIGLVHSPSFDEQLEAAIRAQPVDSLDIPVAAARGNYEAFRQLCEDRIATRRLWAWPATVVGGVVLLGTVVIRRQPAST